MSFSLRRGGGPGLRSGSAERLLHIVAQKAAAMTPVQESRIAKSKSFSEMRSKEGPPMKLTRSIGHAARRRKRSSAEVSRAFGPEKRSRKKHEGSTNPVRESAHHQIGNSRVNISVIQCDLHVI